MKKLTLAAIFSLLLVFAWTSSAHSQDLSGLSFNDRNSIETACVGAYTQGPATYHLCLKSKLAQLGNSQAPDLSGLSFDDRNSIETACVGAYTQGPATYHLCLNSKLARLGNSQAPDLSGLSFDDRNSIETACVGAYTQGPATYHRCLSHQVAELKGSTQPGNKSSISHSNVATRTPATANTNTGTGVQTNPSCSESGSCYGDISERTGLPKTTFVHGYFRKDGTYVRSYYRSK